MNLKQLFMIINKSKYINYWAIPSARKQKLNPRQRDLVANELIAKVCIYYNISNDDIRSKRRYRKMVIARHVAMYLIRKKLHFTLKGIANLFGRDHTTVIHGIQTIQDQCDVDILMNTDIENLNNII